MAVFAGFSFLWAVSFCKQRVNLWLFAHCPLVSFILGVVYGALIEILQFYIFRRRSAEWTDILADAIGSGGGVLLFTLVYTGVLGKIKFQRLGSAHD
jgi:VanZ family protein